MPQVTGTERGQLAFVSLDMLVAHDSVARLIDAFVDTLDLPGMGFAATREMGRPSYDAGALLKPCVYGYRKGIRSSRRLEEACRVNLEAMWLVEGVRPDHRTTNRFRGENVGRLKEVFRRSDERLSGAVEWGFASVDGGKSRASNPEAANLAAHRPGDRTGWGQGHVEEYLRAIEEVDRMEEDGVACESDLATRATIEAKLAELRERTGLYEGYLRELEESGDSQISLTDPDARLTREKNGFVVAYCRTADFATRYESHCDIRAYGADIAM